MKYVVGDIHGHYNPFLELLAISDFDQRHDELILLGDYCDRGPDSCELINHLIEMKADMGDRLITLMGNHDKWLLEEFTTRESPEVWLSHGGQETITSYVRCDYDLNAHIEFLRGCKLYHHDEEQKLGFVHAGIVNGLGHDDERVYLWDRTLVSDALNTGKVSGLNAYDKFFVGHSPTTAFGKGAAPFQIANLIMMDTGVAYPSGKLSMMRVEDMKIWQSDRTCLSQNIMQTDVEVASKIQV